MMKKRIFCLIAALVMLFVLAGFSAAELSTGHSVYADGFMTAEEIEKLEEQISAVETERGIDILVVFTDQPETGDDEQDAAALVSDYIKAGGGLGETKETILFYADMKNRHFRIFENNTDNSKFRLKSSALDAIVEAVVPEMKADLYYTAASRAVERISDKTKPGFFKTLWSRLLIGLGGAGAASGIAVGAHKSTPSVSKRHYMKGGKAETLAMKEFFTGSTTETRHVEEHDSTPSAGSGQSSGAGF